MKTNSFKRSSLADQAEVQAEQVWLEFEKPSIARRVVETVKRIWKKRGTKR